MKLLIGTAGLVDSDKIECAEIEFTHGVNLTKEREDHITKIAKKNDLILSVHAPYFINLNSDDLIKTKASIKRILDSAIAAKKISAKSVVFHPGYYMSKSKKETYENVRKNIVEILNYLNDNDIDVDILPETTGKLSQFGSLNELIKLHDDLGINFCVDFAHIHAYNLGRINYKEIVESIQSFKNIHSHFSGIEFGERGELRHLRINNVDSIQLIDAINNSNFRQMTMICESPEPFQDALMLIEQKNQMNGK